MNEPTDAVHKLTDEQKTAIAEGKPMPGFLDFSKLSDEEAALVYQHVTGNPYTKPASHPS